jgi:surfeit locus 1 family protein
MSGALQRKRLLIPGVIALGGLVVLLGLGTWQLERKAWKEDLMATLATRLQSEPVELPPPEEWPQLAPGTAEFTRVRLNVTFLKSGDALVYTGGSSLRDDVKGVGYFVFSPARLANGRSIVVNRGFASDRSYPQAEGAQESAQEIVGALRWPEASSMFVSDRDSAGATWFVRDHLAMARAKAWGEVAPFYIEQEAPVPPGGVPHPAKLNVRLRNDHLQYAITWYSLAGVLVVIFVIWVRRQRRDKAAGEGVTSGN